MKNVSFATRRDTLGKYVKRKRRLANLLQEAESDEDEIFNVYYQRVIRKKIATYVTNVEIGEGKSILVLQLVF